MLELSSCSGLWGGGGELIAVQIKTFKIEVQILLHRTIQLYMVMLLSFNNILLSWSVVKKGIVVDKVNVSTV